MTSQILPPPPGILDLVQRAEFTRAQGVEALRFRDPPSVSDGRIVERFRITDAGKVKRDAMEKKAAPK